MVDAILREGGHPRSATNYAIERSETGVVLDLNFELLRTTKNRLYFSKPMVLNGPGKPHIIAIVVDEVYQRILSALSPDYSVRHTYQALSLNGKRQKSPVVGLSTLV